MKIHFQFFNKTRAYLNISKTIFQFENLNVQLKCAINLFQVDDPCRILLPQLQRSNMKSMTSNLFQSHRHRVDRFGSIYRFPIGSFRILHSRLVSHSAVLFR